MVDFFASGLVADLIIAMILLEGVALGLYHRLTGKGIPPRELVGFLLSGLCLMLALRAALTGAWWGWVSLWLSAALLTHLADLARRGPSGAPEDKDQAPPRD